MTLKEEVPSCKERVSVGFRNPLFRKLLFAAPVYPPWQVRTSIPLHPPLTLVDTRRTHPSWSLSALAFPLPKLHFAEIRLYSAS